MDYIATVRDGKITLKVPEKDGTRLLVTTEKRWSKRTNDQNKALHLYFELLARELNDSGVSIQMLLKHRMEVPWTKDQVKELLWRPAQEKILGKKSTRELEKLMEIDQVYDVVNRFVGEKVGVHVPFPNIENIGGISNYGSYA
jgi:hypothetical protein